MFGSGINAIDHTKSKDRNKKYMRHLDHVQLSYFRAKTQHLSQSNTIINTPTKQNELTFNFHWKWNTFSKLHHPFTIRQNAFYQRPDFIILRITRCTF